MQTEHLKTNRILSNLRKALQIVSQSTYDMQIKALNLQTDFTSTIDPIFKVNGNEKESKTF